MNHVHSKKISSSFPTTYIVTGSVCLVVAVVLACLGGTSLFNSSVLDPSRLSLLSSAGVASLISLTLLGIGVYKVASHQALKTFLKDPSIQADKKLIPALNMLTTEESQKILKENPSSITQIWDLKITEAHFKHEYWAELLNYEGSEKALRILLEHASLSGLEFVNHGPIIQACFKDTEASGEIKLKWFQTISAFLQEEESFSTVEDYERFLLQVLQQKIDKTSKFSSQHRIQFITMEDKHVLPQAFSFEEILILEKPVRYPSLLFIALTTEDEELVRTILKIFPKLLAHSCYVGGLKLNPSLFSPLTPLDFCKQVLKYDDDHPCVKVLQSKEKQ